MARNVLSYSEMKILEEEMCKEFVQQGLVIFPHEDIAASCTEEFKGLVDPFEVTANNVTRLAKEMGWEPYRKNRPVKDGNPVSRAEFDKLAERVEYAMRILEGLELDKEFQEEPDGSASESDERDAGTGSQPSESEGLLDLG